MMSYRGVEGDALLDGSCHSKTDLGVMPSGMLHFACNGQPSFYSLRREQQCKDCHGQCDTEELSARSAPKFTPL